MKDHNDVFDEFIDVDDEIETDDAQYFGAEDGFDEEDDGDDDDDAFVRTAVLSKKDMLAILSLKANDDGGQIVRFDPREPLPSIQRYESEADARKWFGRSIATSRKNGWTIIYDGEPLVG